MGWFTRTNSTCLICGNQINTNGEKVNWNLKKSDGVSFDDLLRKHPLSESYSCIDGKYLKIETRGPTSPGATVLCCGPCTKTNKEEVAKLAIEAGFKGSCIVHGVQIGTSDALNYSQILQQLGFSAFFITWDESRFG